MLKLYDAPRCPYCARARIALAEKGIQVETVVVDLDDRPREIREVNPPDGRVPVLDHDGFLLPESRPILRYLDELVPEPPLFPGDPRERALVDFALERFERDLGGPYYDLYFERPTGSPEAVGHALAALDARLERSPYVVGERFTAADIGYVPWVLRTEGRLGVPLTPYPALRAWVDRLTERPSVAAELAVVESL
ncbi:MAG: glutathione S-transferase family protein [Thermoleophilia bacterium]